MSITYAIVSLPMPTGTLLMLSGIQPCSSNVCHEEESGEVVYEKKVNTLPLVKLSLLRNC